ncbi:MAG: purine-nucleoside phosphorylase [Bacteroidales bacterium]|jgi:purine-nucleoside phosphorylase
MWKKLTGTAEYLMGKTSVRPQTGIVLGTGLGGLIDEIQIVDKIPYSEIPNFPVTTVEGHHGNLIFGHLDGNPVVAMQGRFHFYEGYSLVDTVFPIRVLKLMGIRQAFLSNAAGGINPDFEVGNLMIIRDHINFFPESPLRGKNIDELGTRFPDMSEPYDKSLILLAHSVAAKLGIGVCEGVYLGNPGPSFETPAEYTHYRLIGADAIGMSTIPEVIAARHMGLPVFAVSVVTNVATPGNFSENTHKDVQIAANLAASNMALLFKGMINESPYSS